MTVADKLTRLSNDVKTAYNAVEAKGGTIPKKKTTGNLAGAIESISGGSGVELSLNRKTSYDVYSATSGVSNNAPFNTKSVRLDVVTTDYAPILKNILELYLNTNSRPVHISKPFGVEIDGVKYPFPVATVDFYATNSWDDSVGRVTLSSGLESFYPGPKYGVGKINTASISTPTSAGKTVWIKPIYNNPEAHIYSGKHYQLQQLTDVVTSNFFANFFQLSVSEVRHVCGLNARVMGSLPATMQQDCLTGLTHTNLFTSFNENTEDTPTYANVGDDPDWFLELNSRFLYSWIWVNDRITLEDAIQQLREMAVYIVYIPNSTKNTDMTTYSNNLTDWQSWVDLGSVEFTNKTVSFYDDTAGSLGPISEVRLSQYPLQFTYTDTVSLASLAGPNPVGKVMTLRGSVEGDQQAALIAPEGVQLPSSDTIWV